MKKKLSIFGCTGSIGETTLNLIKKSKEKYSFYILTGYKNYKKINYLINKYKPNFFVIFDNDTYQKVKKKKYKNKVKILNSNQYFDYNFKKSDISILAIPGIAGLKPTLKATKISKKILIANKESVICGWDLIERYKNKYNVEILPVDSEHFSIMNMINKTNKKNIEKIYLTASGGPFLNFPLKKMKNIKPAQAINHPKWKMGKKISVDSATMMNKVFEVIEAQRIFNIDINKFEILVHPKSYLHAIVKFNNGLIKMLFHDTDMKIPIFNSLYSDQPKKINTNKINFANLNNLNLSYPDTKKFKSLKILKKIENKISLFETILIAANDELVKYFLSGKINFTDINKNLIKIVNLKEFKYYKSKKPTDISQIYNLIEQVRLKTKYLCIK